MDVRLLRTFDVVASTGTVTAASAMLRVTQPALSRQLRQLERQVGVPLFARDSGRLTLTAAGHRFLEAARRVLDSDEAARSVAEHLRAGRLQQLSIVAPTTTLADVLAPFLAGLLPDDPIVTVEEAQHAAAIEALGARADLAIVTAPPPARLRSARIAVLPVWAYVREDHPAAAARRLTVTDLAAERLIVLPPALRPRQLVDEALQAEGLSAAEPIECGNAQVAQALAAAGRGVAIVSDDPRFGLVPCRVEHRHGHLTLTLHAAWRPDHHAGAQLERLAARLRAFCAERYGATASADRPGDGSRRRASPSSAATSRTSGIASGVVR